MTQSARIPPYRRFLAGVLAGLLGFGPLATPSYAAVTLLADQPLNAQSPAPSNVMLTVDDSTSMLFDFLPDSVVTEKYCRGMNGSMNANCGTTGGNTDLTFFNRGKYVSPGYIYQQYGTPYGPYNGYDLSGPGSGCDLTTVLGSTCSGGISPGALPGIERYPNPAGPPPAKSPKAGQPYEYWTLWPAPVHNSELNHIYYNPRSQYDPPVRADGTSYPMMDSVTTTGWTLVPADPWAAVVKYVNLTLPVTIGQWCNSDWTDARFNPGMVDDPAYCRTNGTGASAATSSTSSADGDYLYPWVPPGIDPAGSPTIAKSIAYSKVDNLGAIKPAWANAKDPKYFYQNDNILWCDPTSPLWPQGGALTPQTCVGVVSNAQTCLGFQGQICTGGNPQTCNNVTPQTCNGQQPQTCGNYQGQTCLNAVAQVCNGATPQTCNNIGVQTCDNPAPQTCNGVIPQTCNNITGQICNNVTPQVCNPTVPVCIPPNPSTCTTNWNPPGCNLCQDECGTCTLDTTCPPGTCANSSTNGAACSLASNCPPSGHCSTSNAVCTSNAQCPTLAGTCSVVSSACFLNSDCPLEGHCSTSGAVCQSNANCPTIAGQCSVSNLACTSDPQCVNVGHCSITSAVCPPNLCPDQAGQCSITSLPCFNNLACPPANGLCSVSNAACTSNAQCPTIAGGCSLNGQACTTNAQCGASGTCSITAAVCANNAQCPTVPGACSTSGLSCTVNANCPTLAGTCSGSGLTCMANANCPNLGQTCSVTGLACTSNAQCPIQPGTCSISGLACTANNVIQCPNVVTPGTCSISLAACTSNAQCPGIGSPSGDAVCSDMRSDNLMSLLQDANGPGLVCRHNNRVGGYTSGPYDYPNATFNHPVTAGVGANACVASARYATVPRHYWKTGVEWCDVAIGGAVNATPKWLGYGDGSMGTCQNAQDPTHVYPRFYQFGQPPGTDNDAIPAFRRTDLIVGATYQHDWTDNLGQAQSITRSYVEEMTNYANWFAYYRTRIQAVKTVTSAAFVEIDTKYRVGFHAMFSLPSFLNIADFDAVQKPAWFAKLFGVTIPLGQETPTLTAVTRIGDYFKDGTHPQLSGSTDPITLSCQANFHMLFTDGFTNQSGLPITTVNNVDNLVPSAPVFAGFPIGLTANPIAGLTPGSDWPRPYREDPGATATLNALSDYALAYWVTDLRPGMIDNVPTFNSPPAVNDKYFAAPWQHLNFAALSLGTSGKLPAANQVATELALSNPMGTLQWPKPIPFVNKPDNSGVDDLWHAAINGHADFVNAESIDDLKRGIGQILAGVGNLPGTRTSVGFVSNTFGASANFIYRVLFKQSWSGSLAKIPFDPTTVDPITGIPLPQPPVWDASTQLTATTAVPGGWLTGRRIVTMNEAGVRIPFLWASLGPNQKDSLAPARPLKGQAVLQFLRGDRTKEGISSGQLRVRASALGDIVDSSPVYIGAPNAQYLDATDPGYSGFKTAHSARPAKLYVGANDGMLHVFDDATGNETWAYVPTPLFRGGTATTLVPVPNDPRAGLGALAYQNGALPAFRHHFYVDLTPKIVDVDFNAPNGNQWRTLLVGGMGKGGNRYFALNATDPAAVTDETTAASQILWEFPPVGDNDPLREMGYTYGKPMIAKTRAFGGEWLVTVGSGYNNPTGVGKLYFLKASTGAVEKVMSTGVGNAASPAGLVHPAGYTQDFHNQLAEQVYSGDLLGNFWRFDVSDPTETSWVSGQYAKLISPISFAAQPVTTPPEIKIDLNNGIDRWVFVGTGKLYDESDLLNTQIQTMYALRDGTAAAPWALPATPTDRTTAGMVPLPASIAASNFGLATAPAKGWYHDLPAGSRIVVPPQAAFGVLAYISTNPASTDLCQLGLPVTVYARDYGTGQSVLTANPDGSGPIVFGLDIAQGGVGLQIVTFDPTNGSTAPDVRLAITMPDGTVRYFKPKLPSVFFQHRMSWRLLGQ